MKKYIFPFLALALTACVEDEGNYVYRTLNEITIEDETESIQALSYIDEIEISPKVTGSVYGEDLSNYDFEWHLCDGNDHGHIFLGSEKDLKWKCDAPPGGYVIYLTVTDKETSIAKIYYRSLFLSSPFSRGFLLLGEDLTTQQGGLDMLAMPPNRDTTMVENVYAETEMLTSPEKIIYTGRAPYASAAPMQNLWISANGKDFEVTSGSAFEFVRNFNDAGIIEIPTIPHKTPMRLVDVFPHQGASSTLRNNSWRGYMTEDLMFGTSVFTGDYHTQPINKYSDASKTYFKPAPYIWYTYAYARTSVFVGYDMDSNTFVKLPGSYQYICTPLTDNGAVEWQWNAAAEGRTLVYGENDATGTYGMCNAIMKDAANNYFIYRFQVPTSAYGVIAKQPLYTIDMTKAVDFEKAEHIMFSGIKTAMLYSVGNRIYQYDYARNMCGYLDFDDPVTYLASEFASQGSKDEFFVATYGDQNKGKIYKYEVGSDPNEIAFNLREGEVWNTRLKVKDIEWKYGD